MRNIPPIIPQSRPDLHLLLGEGGTGLIYKHSPWCGRSHWAAQQIGRLRAEMPDLPVVQVDVISERELSDAVATALDVQHESPQAILMHEGVVAWHASHGRVTVDNLRDAIRALPSTPAAS